MCLFKKKKIDEWPGALVDWTPLEIQMALLLKITQFYARQELFSPSHTRKEIPTCKTIHCHIDTSLRCYFNSSTVSVNVWSIHTFFFFSITCLGVVSAFFKSDFFLIFRRMLCLCGLLFQQNQQQHSNAGNVWRLYSTNVRLNQLRLRVITLNIQLLMNSTTLLWYITNQLNVRSRAVTISVSQYLFHGKNKKH